MAPLQSFYGELFGWRYNAMPDAPGYGLVDGQEGSIPGGVGQAFGGPGWSTFYVAVPDIHAKVAEAERSGAKVLSPPRALPDGDLVAMIQDPQGHPVGLFQSTRG